MYTKYITLTLALILLTSCGDDIDTASTLPPEEPTQIQAPIETDVSPDTSEVSKEMIDREIDQELREEQIEDEMNIDQAESMEAEAELGL